MSLNCTTFLCLKALVKLHEREGPKNSQVENNREREDEESDAKSDSSSDIVEVDNASDIDELSDKEDEPPCLKTKSDKEVILFLAETHAVEEMPPGNKSNSVHCIKSEEELKTWLESGKVRYWDLCGQMTDAKPVYTAYRKCEDTGVIKIDKQVDKSNLIKKIRQKKTTTVEGFEDVILIRKTYFQSKLGKKDFKKRSTMVVHVPESLSGALNKTLVEYSGCQPERRHHGNSKRKKTPYTKTHPETKRMIIKELQKKQNKQRVLANLRELSPRKAVKNYRQLVNFEAQLKKSVSGGGNIGNLADDLASLFYAPNDPKYKGYVYSCTTVRHSKYPLIVMMPTNIVKLLKRLCSSGKDPKSVLGCDTTFNLTSALGLDFLEKKH